MNSRLSFVWIWLVLAFSISIADAQTPALLVELQALQKQLVPDKRVAILNVSLNDTLRPTLVSGETNLPEAKQQIIEFMNKKGFAVTDSIKLLPTAVLGNKTWALATLSVSNLRAQPNQASELVSQSIMGTPMKVLDFYDGWYRVQTPDLYIGWMEASGLHCFSEAEMNQWRKSGRWLFNAFTGYVFEAPNRNSQVICDLVLDNLFVVKESGMRFLKIELPDGKTGYVKKSDCISYGNWSNAKPNIDRLLNTAIKMNGSPYLWGGLSSKMVDCSGLVKMAYFTQGIILARDASQQARYGEAIDFTHIENLKPGDLLFFGRSAERIIHVGIYLGNGNYIHASGKVHISSIDPADPKFNITEKKKLVAARRIVNSLGTEGVVQIKKHPWY